MQITVIDRKHTGLTAGDLKAGDVFVRNANDRRPLPARRAYLVLWPHTRLEQIKQYKSTSKDILCVQLHTGRLDSVDSSQAVLQLDAQDVQLCVIQEEKPCRE